ncbi:ABC transporter permease [Ureaplasma sp. ES3154-GEN]|uniref:ABC transporter permease n=1 Tax=Ureaplasma sp. ES3154-GEN TaxID=2984844 RepID=UPI0021E95B55|nr:ABC transporter permease [Ureaplasma sp. ES3154-GEN]MCV3743706.1 ABC transporter permease [Ureaplasma sp. ES3154-GEN]
MLWRLVKNFYAYLWKNKGSFIGLGTLIFISVFAFSLLKNTSTSLNRSYDKIVQEQELHNVVVNEFYNEQSKNEKRALLNKKLAELKTFYQNQGYDLKYERTRALTVSAAQQNVGYQVLQYNNNQSVNIFDAHTLDLLSHYDFNSYNFQKVYELAQSDIPIKLNQVSNKLYKYTNKTFDLDEQNNEALSQEVKTQPQKVADKIEALLDNNQLPSYQAVRNALFQVEMFLENANDNNILKHRFSELKKVLIAHNTIWLSLKNDLPESILFGEWEIVKQPILKIIENQKHLFTNEIYQAWTNKIENQIYLGDGSLRYGSYFDRMEIKDVLASEQNALKLEVEEDEILDSPLAARRFLLSQLVYAKWGNNNDLYANFVRANEYAQINPLYDPLDIRTISSNQILDATTASKVASQFVLTLYPSKKGIISNQEVSVAIKAHRMSFSFTPAGVPVSAYFDAQSSYYAITTPSFINKHHKKIYDVQEYKKRIKDVKTQAEFQNYFASISDEYKIYVDTTPYLIISSSLTPNYMFPIISFESPIPNPEKEGLVYVSADGYERTFDAFRSNPVENNLYIQLKPMNSISRKQLKQTVKKFVDDLNQWIVANEVMAWPSNIDAVFLADDTNNKITPAPLRLVFVQKITTTIKTFSSLITILILALSIFVIVIIVNRFISQNKINIGNLMANGVNRWKIILTFLTIGILPCLLMGVSAFIAAYFTQPAAISLLKDYWMVPTELVSFNFGELIVVIVIPFLIFAGIVSLMLWKLTNKNATDLMKGLESNKVSWFVRLLTRKPAANNMGFARYAFVLSFSSLSRVLLLSIMIMFSFGLILFVTNTRSKILDSMDTTVASKKYRFAIELSTPTIQSGQYHSVSSGHLGSNLYSLVDQNNLHQNYEVSDYFDDIKASSILGNYLNLKLFGEKDDLRTKYDLGYLRNVFQIKQFLDFNFGLANQVTNPWEITRSLIPENSLYMINREYALWSKTIINDHSVLSDSLVSSNQNQEEKNRWANLAYKTLKIQDYKTLKIINSQTELTAHLMHLFDNSQEIFEHSKTYNLDIRLVDSVMNPHFINAQLVYSDGQWNLTYNDRDFKWDQKYLLVHAYYQSNNNPFEYTNDLIPNYSFYDDWYFDLESQDKLFANFQISLSSYFKARFLSPDDQGNFVYETEFSLASLKAYLADHLLNKKIDIELVDQKNVSTKILFSDLEWKDLLITYLNDAKVFVIKNKKTNQQIFLKDQKYVQKYSLDSSKATNQRENNNIANKVHLDYINLVLLTHPGINPLFKNTWGGIGFNTVVIDPYEKENDVFDEPYVYVDSNVIRLNNQPTTGLIRQKQIKMIGLVENSHAVHLFNKEGVLLNPLLRQTQDMIPVIINNVFAKYYNLGVNDQLTIKINNHTDRYSIHKENHQQVLKVVGIANNNQDLQIYTSINNASSVLGMHNDNYSDIQANNKTYPFNGIFTNKKSPDVLTNITPIFSLSGLYPVQERWSKTQENITLINHIINPSYDDLKKAENKQLAQSLIISSQRLLLNALEEYKDINDLKTSLKHLKDEKQQAEFIIEKLASKYGYSTYQALISNVEPLDLMFNVYRTANDTINKIEIVIIVLFISIIMLTIILMITNSFNDLLKVARMLKNMGYSNRKNAILFLLSFLPALFIGIILALPFSMGLISMFNNAVFNTFSLFLPNIFVFWHFVLIVVIISAIFVILWAIAYYALKKSDVASASKRE